MNVDVRIARLKIPAPIRNNIINQPERWRCWRQVDRRGTRRPITYQLKRDHLDGDVLTGSVRRRLTHPTVAEKRIGAGTKKVILRRLTSRRRWIKRQLNEGLGPPTILNHPTSGRESLGSATTSLSRLSPLARDLATSHAGSGTFKLVDRCLEGVLVKRRR